MANRKNNLGVILTLAGLQKIDEARIIFEQQNGFVKRYTYRKIGTVTRLNVNTVIRVLKRQEGVHKRTLEQFFAGFNLELTDKDYVKFIYLKRQNLSEAVCVSNFQGRTIELMRLERYLLIDRCRILSVLGVCGVGKTALIAKLVETIGDKFERVIWKSFRSAPPIDNFLQDLVQFLSDEEVEDLSKLSSLAEKIAKIINCLRSKRCLIIFDGLESIMYSQTYAGMCRTEDRGYEELWRQIAKANHQSCLLITSREQPHSIAALEIEDYPVKTFKLSGLSEAESISILQTKGLKAPESDLRKLAKQYYGNPLAMKIAAAAIDDVFAESVASFLGREIVMFGDLYRLVDKQIMRLSVLEQEIIYWLAIHQEPIEFTQLLQKIGFVISELDLAEILESLLRRSMITFDRSRFALEPIFVEYILCRTLATENTVVLENIVN